MYLYKTDNFFHINYCLKSVWKMALLHRFYCIILTISSLQISTDTVKSVLKATCIKQSSVFKGHFSRPHQRKIGVNLPALSKHLSLATTFLLSPRYLPNTGLTVLLQIPRDRFFYLSLTSMTFFFLHTFHFWKWVFDNAVTSIADVCHIVVTIPWCLVMSLRSVMSVLTMAYRDVLYNQWLSNTWKFLIFIFPTGRLRVCAIKVC